MQRRAFTIVPIVVILAISMVVLAIVLAQKGGTPNIPANVTNRSAYEAGKLLGLGCSALFVIALAGAVADKKGQLFSSLLFGTILALANGAILLNILGVAKPNPLNQAQPAPGTQAMQPQAPSFTSPPPTPAPLSGPTDSSSPAPLASSPSQSGSPTGTPPSQAAPRPAPAAGPPAPSDYDLALAKAKPTIDAFKAELQTRIEEAAAAAEGFVKKVSTAPAHDKKVLKDRAADAGALRHLVEPLEKSLSDADQELRTRLKAAGLTDYEIVAPVGHFAVEYGQHQRSYACVRIRTLCDHVKDESDLLETNFASWSLQKGEITCKDLSQRAKLAMPRFFIDSDLKTFDSVFTDLRGKR